MYICISRCTSPHLSLLLLMNPVFPRDYWDKASYIDDIYVHVHYIYSW